MGEVGVLVQHISYHNNIPSSKAQTILVTPIALRHWRIQDLKIVGAQFVEVASKEEFLSRSLYFCSTKHWKVGKHNKEKRSKMSAVLSIKESPKNIWYVTCRIRTFAEGISVLRLPLQTKAPIGCSGSWVLADALYQLSRIFYIHMQSFGQVQWLLQHPICYTWVRPCSKNYMREEDVKMDAVRARFSNVLKRHSELAERLSRDSDKSIFERLQREFEAARASQTQELNLEGEQWNDGLLATIRERVHIEAERKAMQMPGDTTQLPIPFHDKITYKVGNKVICCLDGARIGIQYDTSFAGESCDLYHCVLESKSFLEKMTVLEHTVPFFLPIREAENEFLSSNAIRFIDHVGDLLQAYVDRREQVRLIKELYGNQIGELYHSLPYHMIEFVLEDFDSKVTVGLRYADLISTLPTGVSVLAWPMYKSKRSSNTNSSSQKGNGAGSPPIPARLTYAEDALRTMSLPEAYAEIVLNLPQALQDMFPHTSST